MSDALLAASILVRGANSALNAAIRADGPTAARLAAVRRDARSAQNTGAADSPAPARPVETRPAATRNAEPSLCFVSTNPWSKDVDRLSLVLTAEGVDLHLQDPAPARATLHADNASLLALLRTPELLAADVDLQGARVENARFRVDGDAGFALAVLKALHGLRPDLLLPLSELVGSGLPSALHTLRATAGGALRGLLDALHPSGAPHAPASSPARAHEHTPPPPPGAATAAPAATRVDDPNEAH